MVYAVSTGEAVQYVHVLLWGIREFLFGISGIDVISSVAAVSSSTLVVVEATSLYSAIVFIVVPLTPVTMFLV